MRGKRDLLGTATGEGDAQVRGRVECSAGTATAGFPTAESALDDTAAQDLVKRRQGAQRSPTLLDQALHVLRLYSRKTRLKQLSSKSRSANLSRDLRNPVI